MPRRRRQRPTASEHLHVRLTIAEKEALWHAADTYDLDISTIIRAWIHERLPVRPDPNSNIRQMPLIGTHLAEVRDQPQLKERPKPSANICTGRKSDPSWHCDHRPHLDFPQCRGCYIEDSRHAESIAQQQAELAASQPKFMMAGRIDNADIDYNLPCHRCHQMPTLEDGPYSVERWTDDTTYQSHQRCPPTPAAEIANQAT